MAGSLVKNDPDAEGTIALWQKVFGFLSKEFPEAAMVSEWGEPDKSLRGGFHMDFLLHFGPSHYNDLFRCDTPYFAGTGDASAFVEKYLESRKKGGPDGLICIPSGNHDMDRLPRALPEAGCRIAFAFLLTMPGAPFIYYGDEIGMQGFEDPFNRAYMGEKKGDDAILKHYIALSRIKDECDALRLGKLMPAFCGNGVFGFYRRHHNETVFCVVNCGNTAQNVGVPKGELLFSKKAKHSCDGILLLPDGCAVFSPANGNATCSTVQ